MIKVEWWACLASTWGFFKTWVSLAIVLTLSLSLSWLMSAEIKSMLISKEELRTENLDNWRVGTHPSVRDYVWLEFSRLLEDFLMVNEQLMASRMEMTSMIIVQWGASRLFSKGLRKYWRNPNNNYFALAASSLQQRSVLKAMFDPMIWKGVQRLATTNMHVIMYGLHVRSSSILASLIISLTLREQSCPRKWNDRDPFKEAAWKEKPFSLERNHERIKVALKLQQDFFRLNMVGKKLFTFEVICFFHRFLKSST